MNIHIARRIFAGVIMGLALVACGGGGDPSLASCPSATNPTFCAEHPQTATTPQTATPQSVIPSTGQVIATLTLAPTALTIGNCTSRVPFIFSGGVGPYTIFTSDNFAVPVSTALVLDDVRSYFLADIRYATNRVAPVTATLTVLDSQSRSAIATVTTPVIADACPANPPLFKLSPESANFRTSEILAFQVSGGLGGSPDPRVTFADEGVAEVIAANSTTITIRAVSAVRATTLMTVENLTDRQRASVVINVLPQ